MESSPRAKVSVRALVVLVAVAVCVYAIDQIAKYLVVTNLPLERSVPVLGDLLSFFYIKNSGAAFSIGSGSTWVFSIIGVGVLVFVVWFARRIRSMAWGVLFGLLLGGLLGNLTDRLFREPGFGVGHVVDFIKIPLLPAYFNIADVGIVSSMVLFLILTLLGVGLDGKRHASHEAVAGSEADAVTPDGETDPVAGAAASQAPAAPETPAAPRRETDRHGDA
ncbi:signal peptidase II [Microbacterium sp. STN6]|uniref:signal peptidase II n=1 Tax=Microbacterium sp. STN6 TaxID=2995588 RepID=UPI002260C365|nr:signal peptidase II [Microbacterium sp. STN6]MCX7521519.1 signal peptidase II [Microbacterium sp. STN6]